MESTTPELTPQDGLKFYRLELDKFKNLEKKIVEIGGKSFVIVGKNGTGKSSLIEALMSPLDVKVVPPKPIKGGETRSTIHVELEGIVGGKPDKYIIDMYFTPKNERGRLVIKDKDGQELKPPATVIKSLIGKVSFDVCHWLNESKAEKLKTLKRLTGCEKQIDIINGQIKDKKIEKSSKEKRAAELEAVLNNHQFSREEIDKYSTPMDIVSPAAELSRVVENQAIYDKVARQTKSYEDTLVFENKKIEAAAAEIGRLKKLILEQEHIIHESEAIVAKAGEQKQKGEEWLARVQRPDATEINNRMMEATKHNEKHHQIGILAEHQKEMLAIKHGLGEYDTQIKKLEKLRDDTIRQSQLPVEGLTFTEDEILMNGIPLEHGGLNKAALIKTCVSIAKALKPMLKVIFIHDGSLFDKEGLKDLIHEIEKDGYQAIIELVGQEKEVQIEFTETTLT